VITLDELKSRVAATKLPSSRKTKVWLERENPNSISAKPALVTAHQALRVWKVRLDTSRARQYGMQELVQRLEQMTPQSRVEQYSFEGKTSTALVFFTKRDNEFIGSIVVER
jgi:hypothetical protein